MIFSFSKFLVCWFIFVGSSLQLDCEDISVNPILPIGCSVINDGLDLAVTNYTQQELQKFSGIKQINGNLQIGVNGFRDGLIYNANLKTLQGFTSLELINGTLICRSNLVLESFIGLDNVTNITGGLLITENNNLKSLSGLHSVLSIGEYVRISKNYNLTSLNGLNSIETIVGDLVIRENNLDCDNICTKNLLHHFGNISNSVIGDECNVTSFICPNILNISAISEQLNNCTYNEECPICNRETCNFETILKGCGDGFVDLENDEECDTLINTTVCNYGQTVCQLCNSTCKNFTAIGSYCGDGILDLENGEECDSISETMCFNCTILPNFSSVPTSTVPFTSISTESESIRSTFVSSTTGSSLEQTSEMESSVIQPSSISNSETESNFISNSETESASSMQSNSETESTFVSNSETESGSSMQSNSEMNSSESTSNAIVNSGTNSNPAISISFPTENSVSNGFDCGLYSCEISENEEIKIFTVETLNLNSNLVILNNQELRISTGNLTLNGYNLSLSSTSTIKVKNGCLDAKHSTLHLNISDLDITPTKKELELVEYECITNEFDNIEPISNSGVCLAVEEIYAANHYSVLISQDPYCVSHSFRFNIYQSFYLIMYLVIIMF